mmetsp:Transcript_39071/g.60871  ORF Transcript_39071/g.60871 Transcript_39071/m.60871 type:complete len:104 (+) Transcript_39071:923-1234(+)
MKATCETATPGLLDGIPGLQMLQPSSKTGAQSLQPDFADMLACSYATPAYHHQPREQERTAKPSPSDGTGRQQDGKKADGVKDASHRGGREGPARARSGTKTR